MEKHVRKAASLTWGFEGPLVLEPYCLSPKLLILLWYVMGFLSRVSMYSSFNVAVELRKGRILEKGDQLGIGAG